MGREPRTGCCKGPSAPIPCWAPPGSDRLRTRPPQGASRRGPTCSPNPTSPSPHLTGFLGILDLHGVGLRGERQPRVRRAEGCGGDSGGSWAALGGPAGSSPRAGRGGPRAGRGRLRRGPGPGGGPPHPREGRPGPSEQGKAAGLAAPGPPAAAPNKRPRSPEPPPPPPPHWEAARPGPAPTWYEYPLSPLSARLLGIVVPRVAKPSSQAAALQMDYKTQDASRALLRGPSASGDGLRVVPERRGRGLNHASDGATNGGWCGRAPEP